MGDPINKPAVREIVRDYYPGADPVDIECITRRAVGAAEVALFDAIRQAGAAAGLREPVRDAAAARR